MPLLCLFWLTICLSQNPTSQLTSMTFYDLFSHRQCGEFQLILGVYILFIISIERERESAFVCLKYIYKALSKRLLKYAFSRDF